MYFIVKSQVPISILERQRTAGEIDFQEKKTVVKENNPKIAAKAFLELEGRVAVDASGFRHRDLTFFFSRRATKLVFSTSAESTTKL